MDCMPHTSLVGKQSFGVTFVYTKYFLKNRDYQKRRRSIDFPTNTKKLADAYRRKTLSPTVNASFGKSVDEIPKEPSIVSLYNYLQLLFSRAKQYAVVHKCLCNALRTRPGDVNGKRVKENRRKLSDTLEQISMLSRKIEGLRLEKSNICQLILQRNIRLYTIIFIEELSLRMSEETERITFAIEESGHSMDGCIEDEASRYCSGRSSALCLSRRNNNYSPNEIHSGCLPKLPVEDCGNHLPFYQMLSKWDPSLKSSNGGLHTVPRGDGNLENSRMLVNYEISDDLTRVHIQCLERKYGGRLRAHTAATKIQKAFRHYRLCKRWKQVLSQAPNSSRSRKNLQLNDYCNQKNFASRYQPMTSLTAQLRAERRETNPMLCTPTTSSSKNDDDVGSEVDSECFTQFATPASENGKTSQYNHRPYLELMSPRLSQRRLNLSVYQLPKSCPDVKRPSNRSNSSGRNASPAISQNNRSASREHSHKSEYQPNKRFHHSESRSSQMRGWRDLHRRRLYRIALNFFNKKPDRGIQLLIGMGFVENVPRSVARLFLERRGLSKQKIGEFLGTIKSPFHYNILESFIEEIPMYDMDIDKALRQLLTHFRLPGEAQKIDHIMQVFARRYRSCNPERFPPNVGSDTVYILAFAIIMLNTDLHTPSLKDSKRMKMDEFIKNICGIEEGQLLDKQMLQGIYERVKEIEFRSGSDHVTQVMKVDQSIIGKEKPKLVEPHRRLICYCRLNQVVDPNKKQAINIHQREVFLFNDMMVIAKIFNKKKSAGQYTLRYWTPLIGVRIEAFQNAFYTFGLVVSCPDGQDIIFNAKNDDDRVRFMSDVRESVAESTEMEQLRIELELDKQNGNISKTTFGNKYRFANEETAHDNSDKLFNDSYGTAQRDSGLPELDQPSSSLCTPSSSLCSFVSD